MSIDINDIDIDLEQEIADSLSSAITELDFPIDFNVHITTDQAYILDHQDPNDFIIVIRKMEGNNLYGQETTPYTIYAYIDNSYVDYARETLDYLVDKFYGVKNIYYYSRLVGTTVETHEIDSHYTYTDGDVLTDVQETFEKSVILADNIPNGVHYSCILYMSVETVMIKNVSKIKEAYFVDDNNVEHKIDFLTAEMHCRITPDTQPFYNSNGLAETQNVFGVFTITLTCINKNDEFNNTIDSMVLRSSDNGKNLNSPVKFKVIYGPNEIPTTFLTTKLNDWSIQTNTGVAPVKIYTFSK